MAVREALCHNCAEAFVFEAKGGVARRLCQECEKYLKWCPPCGYALPHCAFGPDKNCRDGLEGMCRQCRRAAGRGRIQRRTPRQAKAEKLRGRYGIDLDDWERMFASQDGLCAICRVGEPTHLDHCHDTLKVRGILCRNCNIGLGLFADNTDRLIAAANYLDAHRTTPQPAPAGSPGRAPTP